MKIFNLKIKNPSAHTAWLCALTLLISTSSPLQGATAQRSKNLNVLLITIDALRADHLSCYGYKRATTPHIDKIAQEGLLFKNAIAQSSHTPPCIGAIATSTYPPQHQLLQWGDTLKRDLPTIARVLHDQGYDTVFMGSSGAFHDGLKGFNAGFDIFNDVASPAEILTNKIKRFLSRKSKKPFFLWAHYMDVHDYTPATATESLYIHDPYYNNITLPIVPCAPASYGHKGIPACLATKKNNNNNPDYYIAQYDAALHSIDEQIGLLREALPQETLIIITADHGELLGEHGYYFHHGTFIYRPLTHIPLIIKAPFASKKINTATPVSANLSIAPTILTALGIKPPPTFEGQSLLHPSASTHEPSGSVISIGSRHLKSIENDTWKLIHNYRYNTTDLFKIKDDPDEMKDLSKIEPARMDSLEKELATYNKRHPFAQPKARTLYQKTKQRLKALGYLQ